jgi:RNA polymerase sigma-70 factor (ECF subfamily)
MNFKSIWTEYERELSAYVLSRVRDIEIQKEVMQEVALKIFTSLHLQKEHLRGWLYTLTKNAITDYYRKATQPLAELEVVEVDEHVLIECLYPIMDTLKTEEQEILKLTQIQGYSLKEVASKMNLPHNTVKSRLFRAKKSLSSKLFTCCVYEKNDKGEVVGFSDCDDGCTA